MRHTTFFGIEDLLGRYPNLQAIEIWIGSVVDHPPRWDMVDGLLESLIDPEMFPSIKSVRYHVEIESEMKS